ncbi:MAG: hemolysin III family protein [Desulfobacterales bacterium]|nr:hemolysin III family protein [Desulfobacterales bacterium]
MIAAVIGTIYLAIAASDSASGLVTALIYGISVVFLFSASTLYHAFKKEDNELSFWRKMDRLAIFFMIAGTFTPVCYFCLEDPYKWSMIAFQWSLVGVGVISQIFSPERQENCTRLSICSWAGRGFSPSSSYSPTCL